MTKREDLGAIDPKTRAKFRAWLKRHHEENASAWVRVYKGDRARTLLNKNDVVEECLCFGWVDSRPRLRDEASFDLLVSKRNPKSAG
jgi:uncharacterized protein YdeI (YjbR/CyaY-like superfamily)